MEENIELEVSLEIIMSKLADSIFELSKSDSQENKEKLEELIEIQQKAYEGDKNVVDKILKGEVWNGKKNYIKRNTK